MKLKDNVKSMDVLVEYALRQTGLYNKYKEIEAISIWEDLVGKAIASRTKKVEIYSGKMYVSFTSSVVKNEMLMMKQALLNKLRNEIGNDIVKDIIIR